MLRSRPRSWLFVIAVSSLAGLLAPAVPAASARLAVQVDEPFEISGNLYASGKITFKELAAFSPVATLTEVRVDGRSLGVLLAHQQPGHPARHDEVIFERTARGHLALASVGLAGEPVRKLYRLGSGPNTGQWQAVSEPSSVLYAAK